jgi:hypothetical protein
VKSGKVFQITDWTMGTTLAGRAKYRASSFTLSLKISDNNFPRNGREKTLVQPSKSPELKTFVDER